MPEASEPLIFQFLGTSSCGDGYRRTKGRKKRSSDGWHPPGRDTATQAPRGEVPKSCNHVRPRRRQQRFPGITLTWRPRGRCMGFLGSDPIAPSSGRLRRRVRDWHSLWIAASLAWAAKIMKTDEAAGGDSGEFPVAQCAMGNRVLGGVGAAPPQTGPSLHLTISSEEIATIAASTKRLPRWIPSATPGLLQLSMGLISPPSKAGPS